MEIKPGVDRYYGLLGDLSVEDLSGLWLAADDDPSQMVRVGEEEVPQEVVAIELERKSRQSTTGVREVERAEKPLEAIHGTVGAALLRDRR